MRNKWFLHSLFPWPHALSAAGRVRQRKRVSGEKGPCPKPHKREKGWRGREPKEPIKTHKNTIFFCFLGSLPPSRACRSHFWPILPSFRSLPSYLPSTASKPIRFFDFYTREAVDEGRKGTKEGKACKHPSTRKK